MGEQEEQIMVWVCDGYVGRIIELCRRGNLYGNANFHYYSKG